MKRMLVCAIALCALLAGLAAEPINFNTAGIKMDTPKGWAYEIDPDGSMIQIDSPDGLVSVVFVPLTADSLNAALDAAEKAILETSPDAEFGDAETLKLNGLDVIEIAGTGSVDGTEVTISVDVISAKVPVMAVFYTAKGGEKYDKAMVTFIKSIKKM